MGSISHHITPLVINSLGGGHTHTHTHTHAYIRTETILRNQARAWFKNQLYGIRPAFHIKLSVTFARLFILVAWDTTPLVFDT